VTFAGASAKRAHPQRMKTIATTPLGMPAVVFVVSPACGQR
jgi:hypothetical protein